MTTIAKNLRNSVKWKRDSLKYAVKQRKILLSRIPDKLLKYEADDITFSYTERPYGDYHQIGIHFHFSDDYSWSNKKVKLTKIQKVERFLQWLNKHFTYSLDDKFEFHDEDSFRKRGVISLGEEDADFSIVGFSKPEGCRLVKHETTHTYYTAECDNNE